MRKHSNDSWICQKTCQKPISRVNTKEFPGTGADRDGKTGDRSIISIGSENGKELPKDEYPLTEGIQRSGRHSKSTTQGRRKQNNCNEHYTQLENGIRRIRRSDGVHKQDGGISNGIWDRVKPYSRSNGDSTQRLRIRLVAHTLNANANVLKN